MYQILLQIKATRTKKIDLLHRMLKATLQQAEAMECDNIEKLTEALGKRQRLSVMIDELDNAYAELLKLFALKTKQKLTDEFWPGMAECQSKMKEILLKIKLMDQKNAALCEQKLQQYKAQLKDVRQSSHRLSSYVNPFMTKDEGTYLDLKK